MSGDWLKIEKDTPEKPEMFRLAQLLNISQGEAFLACFLAWRWADAMTTDGILHGVQTSVLDAVTRVPGLGSALRPGGLAACDSNLHDLP